MFGMLFRRAQATLDRTIEGMVNRAIVVIPFLIAGGFGTAALAIRLNRDYGPETGSLILGGAFAALGLVAALAVRARSESLVEGEGPLDTAAAPELEAESAADAPDLAKADRELLLAALTSAAPIAVPALVRTVGRNLPLIAALAATAFIIARGDSHGGGGAETALEPGE
jgi:hypothetical protein